MAPKGQMGQMDIKCIFDNGKIFLAKVSQVSDVAHGHLVRLYITIFEQFKDFTLKSFKTT
jgi:hypothetical protein